MSKAGWLLALLTVCGASLWAAPSGNTLFSVEYFYANNGTVTGRKINGDMQHYRYDKRGQLLSVTDATGKVVERYSYDPAGNILAKTIYGQTTTYTYDAANQLVTSTVDGRITRYEYDAAGRLIKEGNKEYKYGYLDKILAVQENGRTTAAFDYHMDGQIATAMTDKGDESFLWDGLALIRRNDTNLVNEPYATGGNPIVSGNDVLFNDMLGSTLGVKGQQNARISMTAFGETNDPNAYFTGKPQIGELGYAFLFRNYRPEQGKWQTQDPIGYPDGWNNFAYVNNMITNAIDKFGWQIQIIGDSDFVRYVENVIITAQLGKNDLSNGISTVYSKPGIVTIQQSDIKTPVTIDKESIRINRYEYTVPTSEGNTRTFSPIEALLHELGHAAGYNDDLEINRLVNGLYNSTELQSRWNNINQRFPPLTRPE